MAYVICPFLSFCFAVNFQVFRYILLKNPPSTYNQRFKCINRSSDFYIYLVENSQFYLISSRMLKLWVRKNKSDQFKDLMLIIRDCWLFWYDISLSICLFTKHNGNYIKTRGISPFNKSVICSRVRLEILLRFKERFLIATSSSSWNSFWFFQFCV